MYHQPLQGGRVVIVGGGVVGTSIAFHLAERGYHEVVVVERGRLGEGATAFATGGIRQQFASRVNVEMGRRSLPVWRNFAERTGQPFVFREHGYMFLLPSAEILSEFAAAADMQRSAGVDTWVLSPSEVLDVFPGVRIDDLAGAAYCPSDGSGSPADAVAGFAKSARAYGAVFRQGTEFLGLTHASDGAVSGVITSDGSLDAEVVLIACGPQAREAGRRCGVDLPVAPHRRQAFALDRMDWVDPGLPLTVDVASGAYVHPEAGGGAVVGGNDRDVPEGTDTSVDWARAESLIEVLMHRFPTMVDAPLTGGWAGLREMTPDDHGILGPVEDVPGLWVAAGFSGHGFMQSPAIGECLAACWLDGVSPIDLSPLRLSRFDGAPLAPESIRF